MSANAREVECMEVPGRGVGRAGWAVKASLANTHCETLKRNQRGAARGQKHGKMYLFPPPLFCSNAEPGSQQKSRLRRTRHRGVSLGHRIPIRQMGARRAVSGPDGALPISFRVTWLRPGSVARAERSSDADPPTGPHADTHRRA